MNDYSYDLRSHRFDLVKDRDEFDRPRREDLGYKDLRDFSLKDNTMDQNSSNRSILDSKVVRRWCFHLKWSVDWTKNFLSGSRKNKFERRDKQSCFTHLDRRCSTMMMIVMTKNIREGTHLFWIRRWIPNELTLKIETKLNLSDRSEETQKLTGSSIVSLAKRRIVRRSLWSMGASVKILFPERRKPFLSQQYEKKQKRTRRISIDLRIGLRQKNAS